MLHTSSRPLSSLRQIRFYAQRLQKETITKLSAATVLAVALILQLAVGVIPFTSTDAQALGADNIISTGVKDKADMLAIYDRGVDAAGHSDIKQIYTHFGVTRQDLVNSTLTTYKTNDFNGQLKTIGRENHPNSGRTQVTVPGAATTIYTGPFLNNANNTAYTIPALVGKRTIDGQWFAITLDCGNIVYQVPPPAPPKPVAVCSGLEVQPIGTTSETTSRGYVLKASASTSGGATIKGYVYSVSKGGSEVFTKTVATTAKTSQTTFTAPADGSYVAKVTVQTSVGDKTGSTCAKTITVTPPPVKNIRVCDLATKKIVTIDEKDYDTKKHSKNLADCKEVETLKVCDLATKTIVTIEKDDYDSEKHSTNLADCEEVPVTPVVPETPPELPKTGFGQMVSATIGIGSIIAAVGYYAASRRNLLAAFLGR